MLCNVDYPLYVTVQTAVIWVTWWESAQNAHWCVSQNHKSPKINPYSTVCSSSQSRLSAWVRNLLGGVDLGLCWKLTEPFRTGLHQIRSCSFGLPLTLSSVPLPCTRSVLSVEFITVICVLRHFLNLWMPVIVLWLCHLPFTYCVHWCWHDPAILLYIGLY
jgi:hypothetical protein